MRDVLPELERWWRAGAVAGLATVVETRRSAPRPAGAAMLVGPDGTVTGSVSGGCVEAAVYEAAWRCRAEGRPTLERFDTAADGSGDDPFGTGLTCGGAIDVFVEPISRRTFPELGEVIADIRAGRPVAVGTVVAGPAEQLLGARVVVRPDALRDGSPPAGGTQLGGDRLDSAVRADALGLLRQGRTGLLRYGPGGQRPGGHRLGDELAVFVASHVPPPRMIVFGAIDFAGALARIGAFLGYRVTVCDARETFATARRFPAADEVVVDQPHRYLASTEVDEATVVCVLTHDPKFDIPLLEVALRRPLAYLGVMGSRRTHADRLARLRARGVADEDLARLRAPIGLDLGGRTPEETAISIAAEIVATRRGGTGAPLRHMSGPLHRDQPLTLTSEIQPLRSDDR